MQLKNLVPLILIALVLGLAGCRPRVQHLVLSGAGAASTAPGSQPAILERRWLWLEWPARVLEKDGDFVELRIALDENGNLAALAPAAKPASGKNLNAPDIYATHNIMAVARLELAGMDAFRGDVREPLVPGRPATFRWSVRADQPGAYQGVVWLHLELVPRNGGDIEEVMLLSKQIEIRSVTVLGLPGPTARIAGGVTLSASAVLGFPFIWQQVKRMASRRKRKFLLNVT